MILQYDDVFASPMGAHRFLYQSTSLTGGENSPATPPAANDPGLETTRVPTKENPMKKHWKWIVAVLVALLALWYFYGTPKTA